MPSSVIALFLARLFHHSTFIHHISCLPPVSRLDTAVAQMNRAFYVSEARHGCERSASTSHICTLAIGTGDIFEQDFRNMLYERCVSVVYHTYIKYGPKTVVFDFWPSNEAINNKNNSINLLVKIQHLSIGGNCYNP